MVGLQRRPVGRVVDARHPRWHHGRVRVPPDRLRRGVVEAEVFAVLPEPHDADGPDRERADDKPEDEQHLESESSSASAHGVPVGWKGTTDGADVKAAVVALQLGRIPVLLAVLQATGWYVDEIRAAQTRLQLEELWGPWAGVSLVSVLFVIGMLVGRRRWHPWVVLTVEAIVAAVVAFVPPLQWVLWFGIGGWIDTMLGGFVQPLAVAWLGVVVLRGFHQLSDGHRANPRRASGSGSATP